MRDEPCLVPLRGRIVDITSDRTARHRFSSHCARLAASAKASRLDLYWARAGPYRNIKLTIGRVFATLDWFREFILACCMLRFSCGRVRIAVEL